jgi:hypothetical protein
MPAAGPKVDATPDSVTQQNAQDAKWFYQPTYKGKCDILVESTKTQPRGIMEKFKEDEEFAFLRDARQRVIRSVQQTTTELTSMRTKLDRFESISRTATATSMSIGEKPESIKKRILSAEIAIKIAKNRLEELQKEPPEKNRT